MKVGHAIDTETLPHAAVNDESFIGGRTETLPADEAALHDQNFIAEALDTLPGLFYVIDTQGRFLRWNKAFESIGGYSAQEMARFGPTEFFADAGRAKVIET